MLPTRFTITSGKWVRFDRYELRENCIVPAPDAKMQVYDPWKLERRPYEALTEIIPADGLNLPAQQPALVAAIVGWCNQYGLLGTLFHRLVMVTLWPRWAWVESDGQEIKEFLVPKQDTYVRLPGVWLTNSISLMSPRTTDASLLGSPLRKDQIPSDMRTPSALVMNIEGSAITEEPFEALSSHTWADHFPDVPISQQATYQYPHPASDEFWKLYGEPVWEVVYAGLMLKKALEAICHPARSRASDWGALRLTQLASSGGPMLKRQADGSFEQRWLAGSLLASLALMAMEDLAGNRLHQCPRCRKFFLADAYQAEYCSARCRHTMQKRRYREKQRKRKRRKRGLHERAS